MNILENDLNQTHLYSAFHNKIVSRCLGVFVITDDIADLIAKLAAHFINVCHYCAFLCQMIKPSI